MERTGLDRSDSSEPRQEHPTSTTLLLLLALMCSLRVVQGFMLEKRLGSETAIATVGAVWAIHELIVERRARRDAT